MAKDSILRQPLVFVDLETTGGGPARSRILEVGVVRVENGRIVNEFRSLLDPEEPVPSFITRLTGITDDDTRGAPRFKHVADELAEILDGAVFVAHNVHFDYGFLRAEFERLGARFRPRLLCTVRLSRALYPHLRGHKLQDLIERFGLRTEHRHRAFDDAQALWQFFQVIQRDFDLDTIEQAITQQLRSQTLPSHLDRTLIDALPEAPGVYIYEDTAGAPLYVGKSVNIRSRVMAHFAGQHDRPVEFKLADQVARIKPIETHGELGALLTESHLVKELQPLFNRQLRRRERVTIALRAYDDAGYARLMLRDADQIEPADGPNLLGVFTTAGVARRALFTAARNFYLCPRLMGLEPGRGACFQYQLRKCFGACREQEPADAYNARFETAFERGRVDDWPYRQAILITETRPNLAGSEAFLVDQWIILARLREAQDGSVTVIRQDHAFDMDMYRILRSYVTGQRNQRRIQLLSPVQVQQLSMMS